MEHAVGAPKIVTAPAAVDRGLFAVLLPVLAPAAVLAALLALAARAAVVADTWLALVTGREIWEHGLPHSNALTVLHHGQSWVDQQWLAHLLLYGADRVGGLGLVVAVCFAAVLCGFGLAGLAALERGAPPVALLTFFCLAFLAGVWIAEVRTQALAVPLYGFVLWLICRDPACSRRLTLFALPALCVWANIHGSVLLGAAVVSAYGLYSAWRSRSRQGAVLALAAPLCVLASPYTTALPGYYRLMLANPPFRRWINEWQPTTPSKLTAVFFLLAAVVALTLVVRRRIGLDALLLVLSFAAGVSAMRMLPWFGITALAVVPPLFSRGGPSGLAGQGARALSIGMTARLSPSTIGYTQTSISPTACSGRSRLCEAAWPTTRGSSSCRPPSCTACSISTRARRAGSRSRTATTCSRSILTARLRSRPCPQAGASHTGARTSCSYGAAEARPGGFAGPRQTIVSLPMRHNG
jgi:hypothetical protein